MFLRFLIALLCAFSLSACVTTETVRFSPQGDNQQVLLRDGHQHMVSRSKNSVVGIRPSTRQIQANARPVYILNIQNTSRQPINFIVANVRVEQLVSGNRMPLQVLSHSELDAEEKNRQTARMVLAAVVAGANAYGNANRGYWAQAHARAENERLIENVAVTGQQNLAALEALVIKDHTLLPGEHYGGQLHISPPEAQSGSKNYVISIVVGDETHEFRVTQAGG